MPKKRSHMSIEPTPLKNIHTALFHQTTQGYMLLKYYLKYINRNEKNKINKQKIKNKTNI